MKYIKKKKRYKKYKRLLKYLTKVRDKTYNLMGRCDKAPLGKVYIDICRCVQSVDNLTKLWRIFEYDKSIYKW